MSPNLLICGLGFIALSIMYYLLIDVFEKSKRLRQAAAIIEHEHVYEPAKAVVVPPLVNEGVYPMYIDCSRKQRLIPSHSKSALSPVSI